MEHISKLALTLSLESALYIQLEFHLENEISSINHCSIIPTFIYLINDEFWHGF